MKKTIIQRIILTVATLLLLSACGVKTVYHNLDWVLEGMVNDYVNLSEPQELDVEKRIALLLKWHKETQLTEYVKDLKQIKKFTAAGLDDESAEILFANFMRRWNSMKARIAPDMAEVFLTLDDKQIKQLFVHLEEENQEITEEYKESTAEERLEKSKEKLIENFSDWLGPLNEQQKAILRTWPPRFEPLDEDRMLFRKKWQAALREVLTGDLSAEDKRSKLIALVETPDHYQSEEHKARLVHNSKQVKQLVLTFDPTITVEQKTYLAERLDYFIVNFEELAKETNEDEFEESEL